MRFTICGGIAMRHAVQATGQDAGGEGVDLGAEDLGVA